MSIFNQIFTLQKITFDLQVIDSLSYIVRYGFRNFEMFYISQPVGF